MLTGNRGQNYFSESNGEFSSDIRTDTSKVDTRPKRNQNTRRAIKEIRTSGSGKALQDMAMDNYKQKVANIDPLSCNSNVTAKHQMIRGRQQNASRNQV